MRGRHGNIRCAQRHVECRTEPPRCYVVESFQLPRRARNQSHSAHLNLALESLYLSRPDHACLPGCRAETRASKVSLRASGHLPVNIAGNSAWRTLWGRPRFDITRKHEVKSLTVGEHDRRLAIAHADQMLGRY